MQHTNTQKMKCLTSHNWHQAVVAYIYLTILWGTHRSYPRLHSGGDGAAAADTLHTAVAVGSSKGAAGRWSSPGTPVEAGEVGGKAPEEEEEGTHHGVDVHGHEVEEGTHLVVVGKGTPDPEVEVDTLKLQWKRLLLPHRHNFKMKFR